MKTMKTIEELIRDLDLGCTGPDPCPRCKRIRASLSEMFKGAVQAQKALAAAHKQELESQRHELAAGISGDLDERVQKGLADQEATFEAQLAEAVQKEREACMALVRTSRTKTVAYSRIKARGA